jgi:hypothetical protein
LLTKSHFFHATKVILQDHNFVRIDLTQSTIEVSTSGAISLPTAAILNLLANSVSATLNAHASYLQFEITHAKPCVLVHMSQFKYKSLNVIACIESMLLILVIFNVVM